MISSRLKRQKNNNQILFRDKYQLRRISLQKEDIALIHKLDFDNRYNLNILLR